MTIRIYKLFLICGFSFLFGLTACWSQATDIEREGVVRSRVLAGHAYFAPVKLPAKGILVEVCTPGWQKVLASTKTDENGYFRFENSKTGKLFYLRLSTPGINTYKLRVRIDRHGARELEIDLHVAT